MLHVLAGEDVAVGVAAPVACPTVDVQTKTTVELAVPKHSVVGYWSAVAQPAADLDRSWPGPLARPAVVGSPCWDLCRTCSQLAFAAAAKVVEEELADDQAVAVGPPGVAGEEPEIETAAASDIAETGFVPSVGFEYVSFSCQCS